MRVMLMIKGDPEPGATPSDGLLAAMGRYNEDLKTAGVLIDLAALHPSGEGKRVRFSLGERTVLEGPFGEKDAVAGYWILEDPRGLVEGRGRRVGEARAVRGTGPDLPR